MKMIKVMAGIILAHCFFACASSSPVSRISAEKQKDLSGDWNDKDIRIVCETLIEECVDSSLINNFIRSKKRVPYIKLGTIMNLSDEYMDTTIVANKFRNAILNGGRLKFVASDSETTSIRNEQISQADHVAPGTEAQMGNERGADFILQGTIKTVIDQTPGIIQKTYYVDIQLFDVETTELLWSAENSDITKIVRKSKYKF